MLGFHVLVYFVVEAALEFGTLPCQFLRIGGNVLKAGCCCRHAVEVFHPRGATELTSAGPDSANASGLLTGTYLPHFYAHPEGFGQHLDELAKVHTPVGYVVEDGFLPVALILHVAYFHVQPQFFGYLARAYHGALLQRLGFLIFFDVHLPRLTIDAAYFGAWLQAGFLHLQGHERPRERHHADVVARTGLYGHHVALGQVESVFVAKVALARVLKLHLHQVVFGGCGSHVGHVVICVELSVLAPHSAAAKAAGVVSRTKVGHIAILL